MKGTLPFTPLPSLHSLHREHEGKANILGLGPDSLARVPRTRATRSPSRGRPSSCSAVCHSDGARRTASCGMCDGDAASATCVACDSCSANCQCRWHQQRGCMIASSCALVPPVCALACCGFDLCHKYILYVYLYLYFPQPRLYARPPSAHLLQCPQRPCAAQSVTALTQRSAWMEKV